MTALDLCTKGEKKVMHMLDRGQLHKHVAALDKGDDASRRDAIQALRRHEERDWAAAPVGVCRALVVSLQQQLVGEGKPPVVLKDVATILGNMGPHSKAAVPQLIELLKEGVADPVRESAVIALGKFGAEARDAVEHLVALAQRRDALAVHAVRTLGAVGCADQRVRGALVSLWHSAAQTAHAQLQTAVALCRLGIDTPGVLPFLTHLLLAGQEQAIRKAAASALAWRNKKEIDVVPALLTAAMNDKDEEVRQIAQASLDQLRLSQPEALRLCAKQLKDSLHAEAALRKSGPLAVPALIEALGADEPVTRLKAAGILAHLGEPAAAAAPALTAMMQDKNPDIRLMAAKGLWNITKQPDPAVSALIQLLEAKRLPGHEDDETRRRFLQTVIEALWRIGPSAQAALPALRDKAKDSNRLIRESAQIALKKIA